MPTFNIGSDCQVVLNGPFGEITLPNETTFSYQAVNENLKVKTLDGYTNTRTVAGNWKLSIMAARADSTVDDLAQGIANSIATGLPVPNGTVQAVIYSADHSTSKTFMWSDASFDVKTMGTYENGKDVKQEIVIEARLRTEQ